MEMTLICKTKKDPKQDIISNLLIERRELEVSLAIMKRRWKKFDNEKQ